MANDLPYVGTVIEIHPEGYWAVVQPDADQIKQDQVTYLDTKSSEFKVGDRVKFALMRPESPHILSMGKEESSTPSPSGIQAKL